MPVDSARTGVMAMTWWHFQVWKVDDQTQTVGCFSHLTNKRIYNQYSFIDCRIHNEHTLQNVDMGVYVCTDTRRTGSLGVRQCVPRQQRGAHKKICSAGHGTGCYKNDRSGNLKIALEMCHLWASLIARDMGT